MRFATIFALAAAFSGVIAAPAAMPQDGTVSIAGNGNRQTTTTTRTRTSTRPTTTTTKTTTTTTTTTTTATPTSTGLPRCKEGLLTFNIKARSLENDSGNFAKSVFDGQFIVDVGGPAGFSPTPRTDYFLSRNEGFITQTEGGEIATVKTKDGGSIPTGDIVWLTPEASIASGYSPLRCTGAFDGKLNCIANNGNRKVAQVCGKFINFDANRNGNCQDEIAFDVVRTCQF